MSSLIVVNKKKNVKALVISILIPLLLGFIAAQLTSGTSEIYKSLERPSFAPPGIVFPIAWTILYILMGIAYYRIWMVGQEGYNIRLQKFFYFAQLFLNFIWTPIFFYFEMRGLALLDIILLFLVVLITIALFNNRDKMSAKLLIPYLLWIIFAMVLNYSVWSLN